MSSLISERFLISQLLCVNSYQFEHQHTFFFVPVKLSTMSYIHAPIVHEYYCNCLYVQQAPDYNNMTLLSIWATIDNKSRRTCDRGAGVNTEI